MIKKSLAPPSFIKSTQNKIHIVSRVSISIRFKSWDQTDQHQYLSNDLIMAEETSISKQISLKKKKMVLTILAGMKLLLFLIPIVVSILYKIENSSLKRKIEKIKSSAGNQILNMSHSTVCKSEKKILSSQNSRLPKSKSTYQ